MKKSLFLWQLAGFVAVSVAGVLLHFLYDWTNESVLIAPFSAVDESTFQHIKLFFFPAAIFAIIESRVIGDKYHSFLCKKLSGILKGIITIPVLYYTYTGILGKNIDWLNITIFFIATAIAFFSEYKALRQNKRCIIGDSLALIFLIFLALLFIIFTFFPPYIPLFQDPLTKLYGI